MARFARDRFRDRGCNTVFPLEILESKSRSRIGRAHATSRFETSAEACPAVDEGVNRGTRVRVRSPGAIWLPCYS